jgi:hypothetical protein
LAVREDAVGVSATWMGIDMTKKSGLLAGIAAGMALAMAASGASATTFLLKDTGLGTTDVLNTTGELTGGDAHVAASAAGISFTDTAVFTIAPGELLTSYSVTSNATSTIANISGGTAEIFTSGGVAIPASLVTIDTVTPGVVTKFTDFSDQFDLGPGSYYIQIVSSGLKTAAAQGNAKFSVELQGVAVPEPATWGVMLMGFGAIGAAMRHSRRRVIA